MPPIIIVLEEHQPDGEAWVRRRIAEMCDDHLTRIASAAALSCLIEPEDETTWIVAHSPRTSTTGAG